MELSKDKTKRKLIELLSNYEWLYQYSIFCDVSHLKYEQAKELAVSWIHDFNDIKFRDSLRKNSDTAILFIVRAGMIRNRLDKKRIKQIYITMYCNGALNLEHCHNYFTEDNASFLNYMCRTVNAWKIDSICNALRKQELHDLSSLGNKKRYSLINKKLLVPIQHDSEPSEQ